MTSISTVTEAEWLTAVGEGLDLTGWTWICHRPGRRAGGKWQTPTQGSSARGFPDIVACRPPRVLWLELKSAAGRVSPQQEVWIGRLRDSGQEAYFIQLLGDWEMFVELTARPPYRMSMTSNSTAADAHLVRPTKIRSQ